MYLPNYELQKMWLAKCLKSAVWEDPSTGNMVKRPKGYFSLNDSTFTIFIDQCEGNWVGKGLS